MEARARRLVERMGLALQASLLVRYGDPAVADAFCASRLDGDGGLAYGTLPRGVDAAAIVERHRPHVSDVMTRQEGKAAAFRALHEGDAFVIPNPWDAGSARVLAALGFEALATTSSGFAFTLGRLDGGATLEEVVAHVAALDEATDLPLSVDLENGYGPDPESVARAITAIADAGAVGGSIEDYDPLPTASTSWARPSSASRPRSRLRAASASRSC